MVLFKLNRKLSILKTTIHAKQFLLMSLNNKLFQMAVFINSPYIYCTKRRYSFQSLLIDNVSPTIWFDHHRYKVIYDKLHTESVLKILTKINGARGAAQREKKQKMDGRYCPPGEETEAFHHSYRFARGLHPRPFLTVTPLVPFLPRQPATQKRKKNMRQPLCRPLTILPMRKRDGGHNAQRTKTSV